MSHKHRKNIEDKIEQGFHRVLYDEMINLEIIDKICGYARTIVSDKDNIKYYAYCSLVDKQCNMIFKKSYNCEEYKKIFE